MAAGNDDGGNAPGSSANGIAAAAAASLSGTRRASPSSSPSPSSPANASSRRVRKMVVKTRPTAATANATSASAAAQAAPLRSRAPLVADESRGQQSMDMLLSRLGSSQWSPLSSPVARGEDVHVTRQQQQSGTPMSSAPVTSAANPAVAPSSPSPPPLASSSSQRAKQTSSPSPSHATAKTILPPQMPTPKRKSPLSTEIRAPPPPSAPIIDNFKTLRDSPELPTQCRSFWKQFVECSEPSASRSAATELAESPPGLPPNRRVSLTTPSQGSPAATGETTQSQRSSSDPRRVFSASPPKTTRATEPLTRPSITQLRPSTTTQPPSTSALSIALVKDEDDMDIDGEPLEVCRDDRGARDALQMLRVSTLPANPVRVADEEDEEEEEDELQSSVADDLDPPTAVAAADVDGEADVDLDTQYREDPQAPNNVQAVAIREGSAGVTNVPHGERVTAMPADATAVSPTRRIIELQLREDLDTEDAPLVAVDVVPVPTPATPAAPATAVVDNNAVDSAVSAVSAVSEPMETTDARNHNEARSSPSAPSAATEKDDGGVVAAESSPSGPVSAMAAPAADDSEANLTVTEAAGNLDQQAGQHDAMEVNDTESLPSRPPPSGDHHGSTADRFSPAQLAAAWGGFDLDSYVHVDDIPGGSYIVDDQQHVPGQRVDLVNDTDSSQQRHRTQSVENAQQQDLPASSGDTSKQTEGNASPANLIVARPESSSSAMGAMTSTETDSNAPSSSQVRTSPPPMFPDTLPFSLDSVTETQSEEPSSNVVEDRARSASGGDATAESREVSMTGSSNSHPPAPAAAQGEEVMDTEDADMPSLADHGDDGGNSNNDNDAGGASGGNVNGSPSRSARLSSSEQRMAPSAGAERRRSRPTPTASSPAPSSSSEVMVMSQSSTHRQSRTTAPSSNDNAREALAVLVQPAATASSTSSEPRILMLDPTLPTAAALKEASQLRRELQASREEQAWLAQRMGTSQEDSVGPDDKSQGQQQQQQQQRQQRQDEPLFVSQDPIETSSGTAAQPHATPRPHKPLPRTSRVAPAPRLQFTQKPYVQVPPPRSELRARRPVSSSLPEQPAADELESRTQQSRAESPSQTQSQTLSQSPPSPSPSQPSSFVLDPNIVAMVRAAQEARRGQKRKPRPSREFYLAEIERGVGKIMENWRRRRTEAAEPAQAQESETSSGNRAISAQR